MGTNKIKYLLILCFLCSNIIIAQAEYIPSNHSIYEFLNRMDSYHFITGFNSIERPFTRRQVARYLSEVESNIVSLNETDKKMLEDYKTEFEFDLYGKLSNSEQLFGNNYHFFDQKEKYLYYASDSSGSAVFVNFIGSLQHIPYYNYTNKNYYDATFVQYGGIIRGTLLKKFGFYLNGSNGKIWGDREPALSIKDLKFNYKYNSDPSVHTAIDYIDNTEGHFSADFDIVRFKIGRDYRQIGFGPVNYILGSNIPKFDYIALDLNYNIFSFSYFHGKLLGLITARVDSVQGSIKQITDKYIAYHRIGFDFSRHFGLGLGEITVYSNRSIDFSYLNPFNFYKSVEHSNQDRDNSMLFLDVKNNTVKGLKVVGAVLIDDIDFGKLGTSWFGNQLLYNLTIYSSNLNHILPLDMTLQYIRIEPYVFTHRIHENSYTHNNYSLSAPIQPNSEILTMVFNYRPIYRMFLNLSLSYMKHGANVLDQNGNLLKNVGGDVLTGHREFDPVNAPFMDGDHEYYRTITFDAVFEPYNNYFITGRVNYENNSLRNQTLNFLAGYVVFDIRL